MTNKNPMPYEDIVHIAGEYAAELQEIIIKRVKQDGINDVGHFSSVAMMTVAALTTHTLLLILANDRDIARAARDQLIKHLERSREWL